MCKPQTILTWALAVSLLGWAAGQTHLAAQQLSTPSGANGPVVDLKIQLEKGLKELSNLILEMILFYVEIILYHFFIMVMVLFITIINYVNFI